ncbi:MAG: cation-translocating P-type ATPase, partial [Planctomycetia bacterium]|nr:cation-translocating P-type ATPase [Planctomycetia bacterium]
YFEVACGVLVMVTLGRWLEAAGRSKAAAALDALTKLLPDRVVVVRDGAEQSVPIGEVAAGDVLRVLPGQRLPVDGVIERGAAEFDEQIITGESQPNFKERGQTVYGGTLNLDGDLLIRATTGAGEGMLRRLVEAVERARATKGAYQRLADLIARWFIPVVTAIALAVFAWHGVRHGWERGSLAGLAVVLIACPCALGLATPLAVWAAMGTAARSGVLIQSGDALERLAGVRAVCFDKTGTLTTGTPQLAEMIVANGATRAEALARAGVLARASTHPLAAAIAREADRSATPVAEGVRSLAGRGMIGTIAGRATLLGSPRLMEESGCRMPPVLRTATEKLHERLMPVVCVGWGGAVRGVFGLTEELRPAAQDCVAACGELGLHVAVLTGDHAARAAALGRQLRVPVTGELLPDDKLAALRELRGARGAVLMVGDGVNDAPALAGADVGVALGCGADVSRQSADVCLTGNDLSRIAWTVGLARRTVRTIRQNLFWAFFYNLLGIALAAAGLLNPIWAGLAMLVSSFLVVANSLRLTRDEGVRQTAAIVAPTDETAEKSVPRRAVPAVEAGHAA